MRRIFGPVRQIGYVVHDLDTALDRFGKLGMGPFYRFDHIPLDYFRVGGQDMAIDLSLAFDYSGGMQFELIQQHNPESSPYKDFLDEKGEGMHHLCVWAEDYKADVANWKAQGYKIAFEGKVGGACFAYFAVPFSPGTYVEVGDLTLWKGAMTKMEDEARVWNGLDPVRSMPELGAEFA
jgi:catechol 2,3-dioxygenase-like lactoylglutathione lyase family enzyme